MIFIAVQLASSSANHASPREEEERAVTPADLDVGPFDNMEAFFDMGAPPSPIAVPSDTGLDAEDSPENLVSQPPNTVTAQAGTRRPAEVLEVSDDSDVVEVVPVRAVRRRVGSPPADNIVCIG